MAHPIGEARRPIADPADYLGELRALIKEAWSLSLKTNGSRSDLGTLQYLLLRAYGLAQNIEQNIEGPNE